MRKIGIVGPQSSLDKIIEVSKITNFEGTLVPFPYENVHDSIEIIRANYHKIDGWLFSGPLPYMLSKNVFQGSQNFAYCTLDGAGLYKCFLQIAYHQQLIMERISIDIPDVEDLSHAIKELEIPGKNIFINRFGRDFSTQAIIDFHRKLWQEGKTSAIITSFNATYELLKKADFLPVYRNSVTTNSVKEALKVILGETTSSFFRDTQVGLCVIEIEHYDEIIKHAVSSYDIKRLELQIAKELVDISEKLNGSLTDLKFGRYEITSSRGLIKQELDMLRLFFQRLSADLKSPIAIGIGFGKNVLATEINAYRALSYAKEQANDKLAIIREDGVLVEKAKGDSGISYHLYSDDQALVQKLSIANVGIENYKRIEAIINYHGWDLFTSAQLAKELSVTERNVRRILSGLEKAGLVECSGKEATTKKGRPSRLFKLC